MKKIIYIIFVGFILLTIPNTVNAESYPEGKFTIIKSSDNDYSFNMFSVGNSVTDMNDIAYEGYKLSDFVIRGRPFKEKEYIEGTPVWEDPDYIIKTGKQTVKILYYDEFNKKNIVFDVLIMGIANTKKNNSLNISNAKLHYAFHRDLIFEGTIDCDILNVFPSIGIYNSMGNRVLGKFSFPDWDNTKVGIFDFTWVFTPDDKNYETISDTIKIRLLPKLEEEIDEPTTPSLTATTIQLDIKTAYDINLDNKVSGSTYLWSTDDTEIVEVNPKNGKIKAKKEGKAKVTCEITLPDGNINILESLVTVGYDENAPLLTETILDLEVGDKFDINLENKIAKSKYRWTSSNRNIVKVNSSNGKVTANGIGEAYVTCTITTPENQVIVLKCDINVTELEIITE